MFGQTCLTKADGKMIAGAAVVLMTSLQIYLTWVQKFFFLLPFLFVPWWQICYLYLGETTITLLSICGFIIIKNRIISSFRLHSKIHGYEKRKGDRYICGANLKKANSFCLLDSWLFAVPMFQSNCFHCAHFAAMSVHFMVVFGVFVQFKLARVFHTVHML